MYSYGEATIDCAMVDDELRHIDEFEDVEASQRPTALCQTCNNPLIYSYGTEKVHHFRHQPGDECSGGGEGMEHYQAKLHIAAVLKETNTITAINRCSQCRTLIGNFVTIEYEDVQLEYVFDNGKKADVGLLKDGKFCGSIEVFVSHRCEYPKIAFHRNSGIPCFEIQAKTATKWIVGKKISPDAIYGAEKFLCAMCEMRQREQPTEIKFKTDLEKPKPEPPKERIKARLIGRKTVMCISAYRQSRELVFEVIEFGEWFNQTKRLQVTEGSLDVEILCDVRAPYNKAQHDLFRQKYKKYLDNFRLFNYEISEGEWKKED
jgi:hypothetical protein